MATRAIADNVDLRIINSANTSTGAANESRTALGGQKHYTWIYEEVIDHVSYTVAKNITHGYMNKSSIMYHDVLHTVSGWAEVQLYPMVGRSHSSSRSGGAIMLLFCCYHISNVCLTAT